MDFYYTRSWNYSLDDVERGFTGLAYADANNIKSEYNYSNIDEPRQFRGTVNYSLPSGFEMDSTMKFTAGRPITARTGVDSNLDGNVTDGKLRAHRCSRKRLSDDSAWGAVRGLNSTN